MSEPEYPHCNTEVLHAPGTCQYCDLYPDRQAMRSASGTPFTPAEANGWYGNVAQPSAKPAAHPGTEIRHYNICRWGAWRIGYNFRPDWDRSLRQPWCGRWWVWIGPWIIGRPDDTW